MSVQLQWNGDGASEYVRQRAAQFLTLAATEVVRRAKELLSVPGTAVRSRTTRHGRKGSRITGAVRSRPGEPPRKQTGQLRASVTHAVDPDKLTVRIGSPLKYGMYLELGTKRGLLPRPWLRRALAESRTKVDALLAQIGGD